MRFQHAEGSSIREQAVAGEEEKTHFPRASSVVAARPPVAQRISLNLARSVPAK